MKDELEDIKLLWQENAMPSKSFVPNTAELDHKKRSLPERLRLTLVVELILNYSLFILAIYWAYTAGQLKLALYLIPAMVIVFTYLHLTIRKFDKFDKNQPTLNYLKQLQTLFKGFLMHYRLGMLFICAYSYVIGLIGGFEEAGTEFKFSIIILIGYLIATAFGMGFTELYLRLMYRKKYRKLNSMVTELDKNEESSN